MLYNTHDIDPAILPLVEILNEIDAIETFSSCEGHDGDYAFSRTPFVSF